MAMKPRTMKKASMARGGTGKKASMARGGTGKKTAEEAKMAKPKPAKAGASFKK